MKMLIVESKAKAKTIQKYLGKTYLVRACMGHVQDLPSGKHKDARKAMWASKEDSLPQPPWHFTPRAKKTVDMLQNDASKANVDEILLATDPDREGEFIAWRLSELLGDIAPCRRIVFHEITMPAIEEAIAAASEIDINLVDAAKVRRFMDRLVGYRTSKFARSWRLKSMGRVQTPTLGFVVDKELEREAFVPTPYFAVKADAQGMNFNARFHETDEEDAWRDQEGKFDSSRTNDETLAKSAFDSLVSEDNLKITNNKSSKYTRRAQPPFTTDALLQSAGSRWGSWTPKRTMRVASELYNAGHITYIRTDSTRTSGTARTSIKELIEKRWGGDHIGAGVLGKQDDSAQDAHEAIRPTRPDVLAPEGIGNDELQLYQLIWARFTASQMNNSEYQRRSLVAEVKGFSKTMTGTYSWRTHPGWEAAFENITTSHPKTSEPDFNIEEGATLQIDKNDDSPSYIEDETKPPRRYRQHSLVAVMKDAGIGRPSTYATTIAKLLERKYVTDESGSLIPTDEGRLCWLEVAPMYTSQDGETQVSFLFSSEFTADMEERLDAIEVGKRGAPSVWNGFTLHFRALHTAAQDIRRSKPTPNQMNKFNQLTSKMSASEIAEHLDNREPETLSGSEMSDVIKAILELGSPPATEKQAKFVISLVDDIEGLELNEALATVKLEDIDDMTMEHASALINTLIEKRDEIPRPASDKQLNLIKKKIEQLETTEADVCKLVGADSLLELTGGRKGTASTLITELINKTGGPRRGRGKKRGGKGKQK
jgi:DNA topoisomerase-1